MMIVVDGEETSTDSIQRWFILAHGFPPSKKIYQLKIDIDLLPFCRETRNTYDRNDTK